MPLIAPDLSRDYANAAFIAGAAEFPGRWQREAAAFREGLGARAMLDQSYGPGERQRFDLFVPPGEARGLMVFVHGGYWLDFGRESWSHFAAGALARGWAVAMPSYDLAPQVRIAQITRQIAAAVAAASARIAGPVVISGHSAGGHLAARMGNLGAERLARVVPISPLADLAPLMQTAMNADLGLDDEEAARESPALWGRVCEAHVWVGGQERPAFLWQARRLSEAWDCPWSVAPGRHHFDVLEDLAAPGSDLVAACLDGL